MDAQRREQRCGRQQETCKEELPRLLARRLQVVVESLARRFGQFEFDRVTSFPLSNRSAVDSVAPGRYVLDPDADHVAAPQLAVDSQIEESQVPFAPVH
jgi:hypothetical protein